VVVGVVVLGSGSAVFAAEARRQRSEYCTESCNVVFERCQSQKGSKNDSLCNVDVVRCKNACPFETIEEPAIPTARSNQRCIDTCRETYKKCLGHAASKRSGRCAADDVRCEQACPKPPEVVAVPPPGSPAAAGSDGAPGAAPVAAPAPVKKAKRGLRVEGGAAPAPISPTPVVVPQPPAAAPPATVKSEAVTPPADTAAAARPEPKERGFFGTLGCFFVACEPSGSPLCLQQCASSYDECHMRESKRGGECNTRLMHCRDSCRDAAPR